MGNVISSQFSSEWSDEWFMEERSKGNDALRFHIPSPKGASRRIVNQFSVSLLSPRAKKGM
jgi:hypothetical protein